MVVYKLGTSQVISQPSRPSAPSDRGAGAYVNPQGQLETHTRDPGRNYVKVEDVVGELYVTPEGRVSPKPAPAPAPTAAELRQRERESMTFTPTSKTEKELREKIYFTPTARTEKEFREKIYFTPEKLITRPIQVTPEPSISQQIYQRYEQAKKSITSPYPVERAVGRYEEEFKRRETLAKEKAREVFGPTIKELERRGITAKTFPRMALESVAPPSLLLLEKTKYGKELAEKRIETEKEYIRKAKEKVKEAQEKADVYLGQAHEWLRKQEFKALYRTDGIGFGQVKKTLVPVIASLGTFITGVGQLAVHPWKGTKEMAGVGYFAISQPREAIGAAGTALGKTISYSGPGHIAGQAAGFYITGRAIVGGAELIGKIPQRLPFISKPMQRAGISREVVREPFVRERATVIIRDEKGRILYEKDASTGMLILPGGAVKEGESIKSAAIRELAEETGLKVKDLKKVDVVTTAREKHYVYEKTVEDLSKLKLKPQRKEIAGLEFISPKRYTGPTPPQPFGERASFFSLKPKVRSDDLYIGSRVQTLQGIKGQLESLTPSQRAGLTELAKEWASETYGTERIKGISSSDLLKEYLLAKQGMTQRTLVIRPPEELFIRRARPVYLKRRVPKFDIKQPSTYLLKLTGRKPGTFYKFQKEPGIVVGFSSRYDIPYKTQKLYEGEGLVYVSGAPQPLTEIPGKPGFIEVLAGKVKRGEKVLYFQPPTTPYIETSEAYVGATYLGILKTKTPSYEAGITFSKKRPTIYLRKDGEELIFTAKARAGVELEKGAPAGPVYRVAGERPSIYLGGERVGIKELELVPSKAGELTQQQIQQTLSRFNELSMAERKAFLNRLKRETGIDYSHLLGEKYVPPASVIVPPASVIKKPSKIKESEILKSELKIKSEIPVFKYKGKRGVGYKTVGPSPGEYVPEPPSKPKPYPSKPFGYGYKYINGNGYKIPPPSPPPTPPPSIITPKYPKPSIRKIAEKIMSTKGYELYVKRYGKYKKMPGLFPKGEAIKKGAILTKETLSARFKVVGTQKYITAKDIPFEPGREFRPYRIVKGRRIALMDEWIQKARHRLGTRPEVREIQAARRSSFFLSKPRKENIKVEGRFWK